MQIKQVTLNYIIQLSTPSCMQKIIFEMCHLDLMMLKKITIIFSNPFMFEFLEFDTL